MFSHCSDRTRQGGSVRDQTYDIVFLVPGWKFQLEALAVAFLHVIDSLILVQEACGLFADESMSRTTKMDIVPSNWSD